MKTEETHEIVEKSARIHNNHIICLSNYNKKWVAVDDFIKCIDDTYNDLDMGKTIPIFIQRLKEKLNIQ